MIAEKSNRMCSSENFSSGKDYEAHSYWSKLRYEQLFITNQTGKNSFV